MISGSGLLAMRNKLQVTDHKIFAWAPLFWALSVTAAIAQEAVGADGADGGQEPLTPSDAITANDSEQVDAADTPSPKPSGTVLDYEPTESISEDLSVSFPVDI
jgi:hypothetical protein